MHTSEPDQRLPVVLIVDDNPHNVRLVAGILSESGRCDLSFATDADEALEVMDHIVPDLILLDVNMPGMNGYELCRVIKAREAWGEIPVIFLTAQRDEEYVLKGFDAGGSDYVSKPFARKELLARILVQLELKQKRDELARRNAELEEALSRIKRLEGIIPICMYCKKIRDDNDSWQQMEKYISEHSDALFSHGICPHCFDRFCSGDR